MLENQAFGWLKNAISRGSTSSGCDSATGNNAANPTSNGHTASIDSCSDVTLLVDGLVEDFEFVLRTSSSTSSSLSSSSSPPPTASSSPLPPESALMSPSEPRQGPQPTPTEPLPQPLDETQNQPDPEKRERHLNDLTARLDRIKSLLYEERSASTHAAHAGSSDPRAHGDVFTPPVATALLNSFTFRRANHGHPALLPRMLHARHLPLLPFEARKSVSAIVNYLLVCGLDGNERDRASYWRVSELFAGYILMCSRGHQEDQDDGGDNYGGIIGQWVRGHYCNHGSGGSDTSNGHIHIHGNNNNPPCVDITLLCGSMLRSSLRHPSIYQWILSSDLNARTFVYPFLNEFVHDPNFDVSSDALETVRVMLTGGGGNAATWPEPYARQSHQEDSEHEDMQQQQQQQQQQPQPHEPLPTPAEIMEQTASQFLQTHYKPVLQTLITQKCLSPHPTKPSNRNPDPNNPDSNSNPNPNPTKPNYMTRRLTLQLLSTLLLNRSNYPIMIRYISSSSNLVTIMCLLRDPSPHITLEAFQVFKIFVANPRKEPEVKKILVDNRVKLVRYLEGFHVEREGVDEQFREEKGLVIATLEGLGMDDDEEELKEGEGR